MHEQEELVMRPVEFVATVNQTLEFALSHVVVEGEIANFRISKNKWVYFDVKDDEASVKCFGSVYQLPGPLEDGMLVKINGTPRLHPRFGFSINLRSVRPSGEGSIKKAAALLEAKLTKEGLFDPARKRTLPYPPERIGLITSGESAAYKDFIKVLNARWQGIEILHKDVQVQGEVAPRQIAGAIELFNTHSDYAVDVLVITRGGGSADDLAAFSDEHVTRAVAASRIPTLVAIGHEVDTSLAEQAADQRASTPSNAAELLVPDKRDQRRQLLSSQQELARLLRSLLHAGKTELDRQKRQLFDVLRDKLVVQREALEQRKKLLQAYSPQHVLKRGFAVVRHNGKAARDASKIPGGAELDIQLSKGRFTARKGEVRQSRIGES
ncbi:MAG: exodeoxyribonuclease VII large subunit [Candidatus Saccharibacteria bacterium]|nr:exodeoxyribonuclease VII large subunit [Candidatus Saccharibacteria bacterium]